MGLKWRGVIRCGACGKPRGLGTHLCNPGSRKRRRHRAQNPVTWECPRCHKPRGLRHTCVIRTDFKARKRKQATRRRQAERKRKRQAATARRAERRKRAAAERRAREKARKKATRDQAAAAAGRQPRAGNLRRHGLPAVRLQGLLRGDVQLPAPARRRGRRLTCCT